RINLFLQQRLASRQFHKRHLGCHTTLFRAPSAQLVHASEHFLHAGFLPTVKCVRRVAPAATQIASRQAHKHTRQPRASPFSLHRLEYFCNEHREEPATTFLRHPAGKSRSTCPSPTQSLP